MSPYFFVIINIHVFYHTATIKQKNKLERDYEGWDAGSDCSYMKKFIRVMLILILLLTLAAGGLAAWQWFSLDNREQPDAKITIGETEIPPEKTELTVPLLFGLFERDLYWENQLVEAELTQAVSEAPKIIFPDPGIGLYEENINIINAAGEIVFEGNKEEYNDFLFPDNGGYIVRVELKKPKVETEEYGRAVFSASVSVEVPKDPELSVSSSTVVQGDTLALLLTNVPEGEAPTAKTDLSLTTFVSMGEGRWVAYTGIADSRDPGEYDITVSFKDFEQTVPITVTKGSFNRQDLTIDTSNPTISEANSDAAYAQYRKAIPPFYETADDKIYWEGTFLQPVEGRLSSEYGLLRYTNGGATPRRHAGIDLAAPEGTEVKAPAAGRVVFSDYLLNTGNTLVIEHGGGLKSYYFHLVERKVKTDDIVSQGQILGNVGTTGYSTGPHLHFELRIGNQNLDPFKFFNGTGGCFAIEEK